MMKNVNEVPTKTASIWKLVAMWIFALALCWIVIDGVNFYYRAPPTVDCNTPYQASAFMYGLKIQTDAGTNYETVVVMGRNIAPKNVGRQEGDNHYAREIFSLLKYRIWAIPDSTTFAQVGWGIQIFHWIDSQGRHVVQPSFSSYTQETDDYFVEKGKILDVDSSNELVWGTMDC